MTFRVNRFKANKFNNINIQPHVFSSALQLPSIKANNLKIPSVNINAKISSGDNQK